MTDFKLGKLHCVIFDWDNTLANSRPVLLAVVNRVLAEYYMPNWDISKKRRHPDLSFRDNFPYIFGEELAEKAYARYRELYLGHVDELISKFPDVDKVLEFFRTRRIPVFVMSNKDRLLMDAELPLLYDKKIFAKVVCGHEAPRDKPHPEQIFYTLDGVMKPSEITPQTVWMIGDSKQDSDCALAANARAIRIGRPIWGIEDKETPGITYINDFTRLLSLLLQDNS